MRQGDHTCQKISLQMLSDLWACKLTQEGEGKREGGRDVKKEGSDPQLSFFLFCFKYLFIWLCQVLVEAREIFHCGMQAPEHMGSVGPVSYGIFNPRPGIKPVSSTLQGRFTTTGPPGKSLSFLEK